MLTARITNHRQHGVVGNVGYPSFSQYLISIFSVLPPPRHASTTTLVSSKPRTEAPVETSTEVVHQPAKPPPYGHRGGFVPKKDVDYGDGGAYPEIHVKQYPLGMGQKGSARSTSLALQVDAEGNVQYDALVRQGHRSDRIIHSDFSAVVPLRQRTDVTELDLERPDEETIRETTERTKLALERLTDSRVRSTQLKHTAVQKTNAPTYVRYTPADATEDGGAQQKIIRMVEAQKDPLEPPKFKYQMNTQMMRPPSPPAPVLHSPPRRVTAEEQEAWKIPPCISNWKNARGYVIPLDKRLAADGRGLQEPVINDRFAKFSEALFAAERHAREEIKERSLMQQKLAEKEKKDKEDHLRMLAQKAREERSGLLDEVRDRAGRFDPEEEARVREREEIRRDRQREHERELRMSRMGAETKTKYLAKQADHRDISEKIALGLAKPTMSKDTMYDQRLFENAATGVSSGFRGDDVYDVYDKPMFNHAAMSSIYRPKRGGEEDDAYGTGNAEEADRMLNQQRFKGVGHKGFEGGESSGGGRGEGPVQFQREDEVDPFGVDQFLDQAKRGKRNAAEESHFEASKRFRD